MLLVDRKEGCTRITLPIDFEPADIDATFYALFNETRDISEKSFSDRTRYSLFRRTRLAEHTEFTMSPRHYQASNGRFD